MISSRHWKFLFLVALTSCVRSQLEVEPAVDKGGAAVAAAEEEESDPTELFNVTTTVEASKCNDAGMCQCTVHAPEPCAYDVEYRQLVHARSQLSSVYAQVKGKVVNTLKVDLALLVKRMTVLEDSLHNQSISLSMTKLADIQGEVTVMKGTIDQLVASVNSTVTTQLAAEVELIRQSLLDLSTKNPIAVKKDLDVELQALRARLSSCSTIATNHKEGILDFLGDGLPANQSITSDHCSLRRNITVGAPVTYKFRNVPGMWLKDPLPVSEDDKTKVYETRINSGTGQRLFSWNVLDDYESANFLTKANQSTCPFSIMGQKVIFLGGQFYEFASSYNGYKIMRWPGLWKSPCKSFSSPDTYYIRSAADYNGNIYNDVDLNFDETGLYAVYPDVNGDMEIARLNPDTLVKETVWKTGKQKKSVANVFMVCGRLYTTDTPKARHLTGTQWGYDTNNDEEFHFKLNVESKFGSIQALSYNPRERALFGWDNGHAVLYPVFV